MIQRLITRSVLFGLLLGPLAAQTPDAAPAGNTSTADSATLRELKAQIEALTHRVEELQDRQDQTERAETAAAAAKKKNGVTVTAGSKGFEIQSEDKQFDLQLKSLLQVQSREFIEPANRGTSPGDGIFLRRARLQFEGLVWGHLTFRIEPEFGARTGGAGGTSASSATLANAFADLNYLDALQFRFGRFKGPVGYERTQYTAANIWVENGLTQNLTPTYNQAFYFHGDVDKGLFGYGAGVEKGVRDNASNDIQATTDNNYQFVGMVNFNPFIHSKDKDLQGLGLNFAGDVGNRGSVAAGSNAPLATYTTPGQTNLLTYNSSGATQFEAGPAYRLTGALYYYNGPFGGYVDYALSSAQAGRTVGSATRYTTLQNDAWQVVGSYVLTGEDADYAHGVKPRHNFDPKNGTWGAFQLVARYGQLNLSQNYFKSTGAAGTVGGPLATQGAREVSNAGLGVNWYLNPNFKAQLEYDYTDFTGGTYAVTPGNRDQSSILTQLQLAF